LHRSCQEFEQVKDPYSVTTWDWPGFQTVFGKFRLWDVSVPIPEPERALSYGVCTASALQSPETTRQAATSRRKLTSKRALQRTTAVAVTAEGHHTPIKSRTAVDAFNNGQATVIIMMENNTASQAKCRGSSFAK
jgi:hypothetical protein